MRRERILVYSLVGLLVVLQYPLWFGSGGVLALWRLNREISAQKGDNAALHERNAALEAEVGDLKRGYDAIEERARNELGMVKRNETFYQIIDVLPRTQGEK